MCECRGGSDGGGCPRVMTHSYVGHDSAMVVDALVFAQTRDRCKDTR